MTYACVIWDNATIICNGQWNEILDKWNNPWNMNLCNLHWCLFLSPNKLVQIHNSWCSQLTEVRDSQWVHERQNCVNVLVYTPSFYSKATKATCSERMASSMHPAIPSPLHSNQLINTFKSMPLVTPLPMKVYNYIYITIILLSNAYILYNYVY